MLTDYRFGFYFETGIVQKYCEKLKKLLLTRKKLMGEQGKFCKGN